MTLVLSDEARNRVDSSFFQTATSLRHHVKGLSQLRNMLQIIMGHRCHDWELEIAQRWKGNARFIRDSYCFELVTVAVAKIWEMFVTRLSSKPIATNMSSSDKCETKNTSFAFEVCSR